MPRCGCSSVRFATWPPPQRILIVMANPWFRLYSEFMHDPKVQRMEEKHQRRLVMILCMRCNGDVTLRNEDVTFMLRISDAEWAESKSVFIEQGFINSDGEVLNWDKRQMASDSSRARVAKHRSLHKPITVTTCNVTVTPQNRTEQNIKEETIVTSKAADIPYSEIVKQYHEHLPMLPSVKVLTEKRKQAIKARWLEDKKRQHLDWWARYFKFVSTIPFLTGENDRGWQADIDFLFALKSFVKIIEGGYERRT